MVLRAHETEIQLLQNSTALWQWWNYEEYKKQLSSMEGENAYISYIIKVASTTASDLKEFEGFIFGPKDQVESYLLQQAKILEQFEKHLMKGICTLFSPPSSPALRFIT